MADDAPAEIQINVKGPSELKLQISITVDKTVLELKQAIAATSDVEADRQRLIYSGRVLKDEDQLSVYKIQSNHTIHMVKGQPRSSGGSSSQSAAPQPLPTMQAGQNPHDPLTQLNGHMGHGLMAGLNPFADMGLNPNDPNMLQGMLDSPQFLQQMSSVMSNPAILDQLLAANPQLSAMGPQLRQMFQSDRFRELVSNPDSLRTMLQMSAMMQNPGNPFGGGGNPFGAGSGGGFPAPGLPTDGSVPASTTPNSTAAPGTFEPLWSQTPAAGAQPNPFAAFFGGAGAGAGAGAGSPVGTGANPVGIFDPALMQQLMASNGGGAGLFGPFGGGGAAAAPPADTRSPEERFQVQLQQLQDMGFTNAAQNVRALLATGGNVHSAIEYILGGGGL